MFSPLLTHSSYTNLQRINNIRLIVIALLLAAFAYALYLGYPPLSFKAHIYLFAFYTCITLLTIMRLHKPKPTSDREYGLQLLLDVLCISGFLYVSGGASNPFVSYYLVPLSISAALLPWRYTWLIACISLSAYTTMLFYYQPLPLGNDHIHLSSNSFNQHVLGMWINFVLSAGLITFFVVKMANSLRQQEEQLTQHRENTLRDEHILAVATLAASTAHELGTPLSTMTVLLDELKDEYKNQSDLNNDLQLLGEQLKHCRKTLRNLVNTAETHSHKHHESKPLVEHIETLLAQWELLRPEVSYRLIVTQTTPPPQATVTSTLDLAILNILNNAADAEPKDIKISLSWTAQHYTLQIHDQGPGISPLDASHIGKPYISHKGEGLGLGLFLSHATIQRYGGEIQLFEHPEQGTIALIQLALHP